MKTDLKEVLANLPDFEQFLELAETMRITSVKKLTLEKELKEKEAEVIRTVTSDPQYFNGGKSPSFNYIDSTYRYTGFKGELLPIRAELIEATATLDHLKLKMDIYKNLLEIWRTLSANERSSSL